MHSLTNSDELLERLARKAAALNLAVERLVAPHCILRQNVTAKMTLCHRRSRCRFEIGSKILIPGSPTCKLVPSATRQGLSWMTAGRVFTKDAANERAAGC